MKIYYQYKKEEYPCVINYSTNLKSFSDQCYAKNYYSFHIPLTSPALHVTKQKKTPLTRYAHMQKETLKILP